MNPINQLQVIRDKFWDRKPSLIAGFVVWGSSGFMAQPTLASLVYHLGIIPIALGVVIWLANHEGRRYYIKRAAKQFDYRKPKMPEF